MKDFYREIELTVMNTEALYNVAKGIKDVSLSGDEIVNFTDAVLQTIKDNGGELPQMLTDKQVMDVREKVRSVMADVQLPEKVEA